MRWFIGSLIFLSTFPLYASQEIQHDPMTSLALFLAVLLLAAKLGGDLAVRLGQPPVLGEILSGLLLGNLSLAGFDALEPIKANSSIDFLARLGVLLLLFEAGLETTVPQMRKVGWTALGATSLGLTVSFALGWMASAWLLPESSPYVHAFLGAALCATSVGITARVLKDLGQIKTQTARVILGAAAMDDVLALIVLAVMTGVLSAAADGGFFSWADIGSILFKAAAFLGLSLALGRAFSKNLFHFASKLRARGVLLAVGLAFCFLLSWAAGAMGLAPLIGAFAAGVILEDLHFKDFVNRGEKSLMDLVHPISSFIVPLFFVLIGMRTDLRTFIQPGMLPLALGLTAAALLGKQACSLGVFGKGLNKLAVGIGMMPRGEVSLIFASIGTSLMLGGKPLLDGVAYSAIVVMVVLTTLATPPALMWGFDRSRKR